MTRQQYYICKFILKNGNLQEICQKFNLDYLDLQYKLGDNALEFSDTNMDSNTTVLLTDDYVERFEKEQSRNIDKYITRTLAILGGVTGTVSLIVDIAQALL